VNMPTTHQNFSDDMLINGAIKRGERVDLFTRSTSLTWSNIVKDIAAFYDIDDAISDRLKLNFTMYICDNGNMKEVRLVAVPNIFANELRMYSDKKLTEYPTYFE